MTCVRVPTRDSLVVDRWVGVLSAVILAAALMGPRSLVWPLSSLGTLVVLASGPMSKSRQRQGNADFSRVTAKERRAFLLRDTAAAFGVLICIGVAMAAILMPANSALKTAALVALPLGVLSGVYRGKWAKEHGDKVAPGPDLTIEA